MARERWIGYRISVARWMAVGTVKNEDGSNGADESLMNESWRLCEDGRGMEAGLCLLEVFAKVTGHILKMEQV